MPRGLACACSAGLLGFRQAHCVRQALAASWRIQVVVKIITSSSSTRILDNHCCVRGNGMQAHFGGGAARGRTRNNHSWSGLASWPREAPALTDGGFAMSPDHGSREGSDAPGHRGSCRSARSWIASRYLAWSSGLMNRLRLLWMPAGGMTNGGGAWGCRASCSAAFRALVAAVFARRRARRRLSRPRFCRPTLHCRQRGRPSFSV